MMYFKCLSNCQCIYLKPNNMRRWNANGLCLQLIFFWLPAIEGLYVHSSLSNWGEANGSCQLAHPENLTGSAVRDAVGEKEIEMWMAPWYTSWISVQGCYLTGNLAPLFRLESTTDDGIQTATVAICQQFCSTGIFAISSTDQCVCYNGIPSSAFLQRCTLRPCVGDERDLCAVGDFHRLVYKKEQVFNFRYEGKDDCFAVRSIVNNVTSYTTLPCSSLQERFCWNGAQTGSPRIFPYSNPTNWSSAVVLCSVLRHGISPITLVGINVTRPNWIGYFRRRIFLPVRGNCPFARLYRNMSLSFNLGLCSTQRPFLCFGQVPMTSTTLTSTIKTGVRDMNTRETPGSFTSTYIYILIGAGVGSAALIAMLIIIVMICYKKRKKRKTDGETEVYYSKAPHEYSEMMDENDNPESRCEILQSIPGEDTEGEYDHIQHNNRQKHLITDPLYDSMETLSEDSPLYSHVGEKNKDNFLSADVYDSTVIQR